MKKTLITILLALPIVIWGQNNSSVDFVMGIDYSYRLITSSDENHQSLIKGRKSEEAKLGWQFGFNYNKKINNHFYLKTGLRIDRKGYKSKLFSDLQFGSKYDPSTGQVNPDFPGIESLQTEYDYFFIEVPIVGRYILKNSKLSPYVELGLAPAWLIQSRSISIINGSKTIRDAQNEPINKFQIVGLFSFGVNYSINTKFQLFAQPNFRYHITKAFDAPINEHFWKLGIEMGIRKMF